MLIRLAITFGLAAVILVAIWFLTTSQRRKQADEPLVEGANVVVTTSLGEVRVPVEVARADVEKFQGLSDRKVLDTDHGMLFVWNSDIISKFAMRRMEFPLDIIFIKGGTENSGTVVEIAENLPACPGQTIGCATAGSPEPFRYVLEVNAGFSQKKGIAVGDTITISFSE